MCLKNSIFSSRARLLIFIVQMAVDVILSQLHYMVPEESKHGTFVGRIAQDLGMHINDINSRRLRIVSKDGTDYFQVNLQNGILFVNKLIDREKLCPETSICIVQLEIIVDKPVQIHHVDVEIEDINDNYPVFSSKEFKLFISEVRLPGSHFPLEGAVDADIGSNSITNYELSSSEYFTLDVQTYTQKTKSVQLVLKKALDREQIPLHNLTLTAFDRGKPKLSGTTQLYIIVQDINDNVPLFDQPFYTVSLLENSLNGTVVTTLNAIDLDEGENGDIFYTFNKVASQYITSVFSIEQNTGIIRVIGDVDFERKNVYEIEVDATDRGASALTGHCKVIVNVVDINDNPPEMAVTSLNAPVPEDVSLGSVVAVISVHDRDSGLNGKVNCNISKNVPFKITSTLREYFSLVVDGPLDREIVSEYDIDIVATDEGSPALSVKKSIKIEISDVNDNPPTFPHISETISVKENNPPGSHIYTALAGDSDINQNSFITYSLIDSSIDGIPVSSYISVNPENGKVFALLSFDHEQMAHFQCRIKAIDAGLPPLSSNLTLHVFIDDVNDNAPSLITPYLSSEYRLTEMVSRSAAEGHLVTKIKAVDADTGYNAWLSYEFKDPAQNIPFSVGHQTGEITLIRPLMESDSDEHRLSIIVKDHGDPEISSTVTLVILLVESGEDLPVETKHHKRKENDFSDANIYLIMSICLISTIFLITLIVYTVLRWHKYTQEINDLKQHNVCPSIAGSWTYSQQRQYKICLTGPPAKNDLILFTPNYPQSSLDDTISNNGSLTTDSAGKPKHPHPDWRYSASLRAAMQGAVHVEGAAILRGGPVGLEQQWPTVSSATPEPEGGEVSPPVGAGVNCNSWTFKYGPGNQKQPVPQIPPDFPENFIIPGSPAIISIRQDQPSNQGQKSNFITFGKKEETKKKKKKKKGSKNQEKGNNAVDNNDQ
ncbi:protocadherin alpha-6-like isoform X4 [Spea bombifrons]|uniref:protocadherin alpha-6-like isoform X4 n=1 Tax=Spea bombifrons TaxID=233779 RepID=UPI002348FC21|nr:protocadherin alpha-6-like isoform X4 [Spea bombifrons]